MNLEYYQDQFDMVSQCKDPKSRDNQLSMLMTNMEFTYNIPMVNDEAFNMSNPHVVELYHKVSNARTIINKDKESA